MPEVNVADETWLPAPPGRIASTVAWPRNWHSWWPELDLQADELRGERGVRWRVRCPRFHGSMEIYLQSQDGGTLAHFFLRVDGCAHPLRPRERARLVRDYRRRAKLIFWAISDRVYPGRPGRPARVSASRSL